ncbi:MAG: Calx-beta domain-containing protein [Verrucomicrobiota bacterium]
MNTKSLLFVALGVCLSVIAHFNSTAAELPVVLDASFDVGTGPNGAVNALVVQPNGQVLIAGDFTEVNGIPRKSVARLNADGSLDQSFEINPNQLHFKYPGEPSIFLLEPDGRILVGGSRFNTDGSPDTVYNLRPGSFEFISTLLRRDDGKLLVSLYDAQRHRIVRLNSDGSLDASFHFQAISPNMVALALEPSGSILVGLGGDSERLVRLTADGSVDATFNASNVVSVTALIVRGDGKLLVAGSFANVGGVTIRNGIAKLNADGSIETILEPQLPLGYRLSYWPIFRALPGGKLLVSAYWQAPGEWPDGSDGSPFALIVLNADGSFDHALKLDYGVTGSIRAAAVQADGNILIGGQFSSLNGAPPRKLARLFGDSTGLRSVGFAAGAFSVAENAGTATVTLERRGESSRTVSVRYATSDGTGKRGVNYTAQSGVITFGPLQTSNRFTIPIIDDGLPLGSRTVKVTLSEPTTGVLLGGVREALIQIQDGQTLFSPDTSFNPSIGLSALTLQPDGKVLGINNQTITRLNADGSLDSTFNARLSFASDQSLVLFLLQKDGKIVIAGPFTNASGVASGGLARLNDDGSLDTNFAPALNALSDFYALALQADGKILVSGADNKGSWLQRFNPDGSSDASFHAGFNLGNTIANPVNLIRLQADRKILIKVELTSINGRRIVDLVRLDPDGTVDLSFQPDKFEPATTDNEVFLEALQLLPSGKIVVGGSFGFVGGIPRRNLAWLNTDGSLDKSLDAGTIAQHGNSGGVEDEYSGVMTLALQPDGKLLLGGSFGRFDGPHQPFIARLNPNGSLDPTFDAGTFGSSFDDYGRPGVYAIAVQPDGQILIGGGFHSINGHYAPNLARVSGDLQHAGIEFRSSYFAAGEPAGAAVISVDRTGDIRAAASVNYATADGTAKAGQRYQAQTGTLNFAPFERSKTFTVPLIDDLLVGKDETVQLTLSDPAGGAALGLAQASLTIVDDERPGSFDFSFHSPLDTNYFCGGFGFPPGVTRLVVQPDGKILLLDSDCRRQPPIRLNADGSVDPGFHTVFPEDFLYSNSLLLQPDGKILVQSDTGLVRLNSDGSHDPGFVAPFFPIGGLYGAILQPPDKVIIYGRFIVTNGAVAQHLARLNQDGSLDPIFHPIIEPNDTLLSVLVQPDGRLLTLAYNSRLNQNRAQLSRLLADGSRDGSFAPSSSVADRSSVMALQPDGKLLITHLFPDSKDGQVHPGLIRLNADGSQDPTFISWELAGGGVGGPTAILPQADGKILIGGGSFASYRGDIDTAFARRLIARLNTDGSEDATFDVGAGLWGPMEGPVVLLGSRATIMTLALQPDGQVLIGGYFTSVNGLPAIGLARLNGDGVPRFDSITKLNNGGVRLGVTIRPGQTVVIESSTDLRSWMPVQTNATSGASIDYTDPSLAGTPARFYRAVRQ